MSTKYAPIRLHSLCAKLDDEEQWAGFHQMQADVASGKLKHTPGVSTYLLDGKPFERWELPYSVMQPDTYVYMGEIPNMPGHGIFLKMSNSKDTHEMIVGLHTDSFRELTEDEV